MERMRKIMSLLLVFGLCFTLIPTNVEAASKVKINKTKTTIYVGKTETLKISGTKKTAKWTTSNKKVATVSSKGKVTAKKAGSATITVKVAGKSYKCKVTVKNPYINTTSKTLYVSDTYTLKLTGTTIKTVKSSNPEIATINTKGKVTAKKAGNTTITLTGKDKKSYKCNITVKEKVHVHSYIQKVIEPTCTEKGYTLYICSCGDSYISDYTEAAHKWSDWVITKDAGTEVHTSVEQFGERVATCTVCGEKKTQTIINIDASNYNARSDEYASNLVFIGDNIIQEYGEFCDDMALETYEMVSELRTSLGLNELKWVDKMEFTGKIRSVETQILYSHERPNGQKPTYTIPNGLDGIVIYLGENIAIADETAASVFEGWCESPGHYANIINSKSNHYYAACFKTEYGYSWVQLFY